MKIKLFRFLQLEQTATHRLQIDTCVKRLFVFVLRTHNGCMYH